MIEADAYRRSHFQAFYIGESNAAALKGETVALFSLCDAPPDAIESPRTTGLFNAVPECGQT